MKNQVIIITNKSDYTADFLIKRLYKRDIKFVRINTEEFPQEIHGTVFINNIKNEISLKSNSWEIIPDYINGIWYRRPIKPSISGLSKQDKEFAERECSEFLLNAWHLLYDKLWINNPTFLIRAERKLVQLQLANDIGFAIPDTIVSNHPADINNFINNYNNDVIVKPISHGDYDNSSSAIFTNPIGNNKYSLSDESIKYAPFIVQNRVDKIADIRVNVFGNAIFAFKLIPKNDYSSLDWRKLEPNQIDYELIEPPSEIRRKINTMVQMLSLSFCVFDFALSRSDNWVFLEINPNGQWAWLEQITKVTMSDFLIDLLIAKNKNENIQ